MSDDSVETGSKRRALPPWSQEVTHKVFELRDLVPNIDAAHLDDVNTLLDEAEALATLRKTGFAVWAQIREWWYGSRIEQAWTCLHQAELGLVEHGKADFQKTTALEIALAQASVLDPKDPVRVRLETYVRGLPDPAHPQPPVPAGHAQAHAVAHAGAVAAAPRSTTTTTTSTSTTTPRS